MKKHCGSDNPAPNWKGPGIEPPTSPADGNVLNQYANQLVIINVKHVNLLQVWSAFGKEYQVIQHMTTSGGVSRILMSPDGSKMLAATPGSSFRVFETALWANERWAKLAGRIQVT